GGEHGAGVSLSSGSLSARSWRLRNEILPRNRPRLAAMDAVVGSGDDDVVDRGEGAGRGGVAAGGDVAEPDGSGGGAVGPPGLQAGEVVVGGEEEDTADRGQRLR